jgi:hypothetical protein
MDRRVQPVSATFAPMDTHVISIQIIICSASAVPKEEPSRKCPYLHPRPAHCWVWMLHDAIHYNAPRHIDRGVDPVRRRKQSAHRLLRRFPHMRRGLAGGLHFGLMRTFARTFSGLWSGAVFFWRTPFAARKLRRSSKLRIQEQQVRYLRVAPAIDDPSRACRPVVGNCGAAPRRRCIGQLYRLSSSTRHCL